ncbi:MAG: hypothetical protein V1736_04355 [Pseudomonadota bacterium]
MKQDDDSNDKSQETAEERLSTLIKQAGEEARVRKREALACHFRKLQAVIHEAMSKQPGPNQT